MLDAAIRQALRRMGTRADALGTCPACGQTIKPGEAKVRAWHGTYAHRRCASYRRRGHSQPVHDSFTAT